MRFKHKGMFGPVEVQDQNGIRRLLMNNQVQGGAFLEPSAAVVSPDLGEEDPGPISASAYTNGWLLAGVMNCTGSMLMVGLGSGAGVISLLYNFPGVDITVLEIDPVVVSAALRGFPLLAWYLNTGQLNICIEDAEVYLTEHYDRWDVGFADGFTGERDLATGYIPLLCERTDNLYLNVIDRFRGDSMQGVVQLLEQKGKPVKELVRATFPEQDHAYTTTANWIVTTQAPDWVEAARFVPYPRLETPSAIYARAGWDYFLTSALSHVG